MLARKVTARRFASSAHVMASQWGDFTGPVDDSLAKAGLRRTVTVVVPGSPDALRIAGATDLVTVVPRLMLGGPLLVDPKTRGRAHALPTPASTIRSDQIRTQ